MDERGLPGVRGGKRRMGEPALGPRERRRRHPVSRICGEMWVMGRAVPGYRPRVRRWGWVPRGQGDVSGGPPPCGDVGAGEGGAAQAVQGGDIRDGGAGGDPQFWISVPGAMFPVRFSRCPWPSLVRCRFPVPVPGPTAPVGAAPPRRT